MSIAWLPASSFWVSSDAIGPPLKPGASSLGLAPDWSPAALEAWKKETGYDDAHFYETPLLGNLVWGDHEFGKQAEGTGRKSDAVFELLKKLKAGRSIKVIAQLKAVIRRLRAKRRAAVQSELEYFQTHRDRLDYHIAQKHGQPLGSGAIESTCRQYQCRFKRPGQFWTRTGDEALMCLETFWRNRRWHLLFPHSSDPSKN